MFSSKSEGHEMWLKALQEVQRLDLETVLSNKSQTGQLFIGKKKDGKHTYIRDPLCHIRCLSVEASHYGSRSSSHQLSLSQSPNVYFFLSRKVENGLLKQLLPSCFKYHFYKVSLSPLSLFGFLVPLHVSSIGVAKML